MDELSWSIENCKSYAAALTAADLTVIQRLFVPDAVVESPIYGTVPFATFYRTLFSDSKNSDVRLLSTYKGTGTPEVAALLRYAWTLRNGNKVQFDCVDVFALSLDERRFAGLRIFYDTSNIKRQELRSAKHRHNDSGRD